MVLYLDSGNMYNFLQPVSEGSDIFTTTGIVTILVALGALITTIFTAYSAFRAKITAEEVKEVNKDQTKKLDNITVLVDGRYSAVLQELADVKKLLAISTGEKSDDLKADKAQVIADNQSNQVKIASEQNLIKKEV